MSVHAMSWVWEHSRSKGTVRLVLLALADHAGSDGGDAYPSVRRVALRCGMSPRAVQSAIKKLRSLGELEVELQAGPRGANRYRIPMASIPADPAPRNICTPQISHPPHAESAPPAPQHLHPPPADPAPEPPRTVKEPSLNRPSRSNAARLDAEFQQWWQHYPKKKAKGAARAAFAKARKTASLEALIAGADAYANDPERKPDFTKHPATWLSGGCWEDEPDTEARHSDAVVTAQRFIDRHTGPVIEVRGELTS